MAVGTTTAILLGLAGGAAGMGVSRMMQPKNQSSGPIPLPQAPSVSDATGKAEDVIRKKRSSMTQSIYTSPLGASGEAQVVRKTLLGQ
jgi:hypothetical protein